MVLVRQERYLVWGVFSCARIAAWPESDQWAHLQACGTHSYLFGKLRGAEGRDLARKNNTFNVAAHTSSKEYYFYKGKNCSFLTGVKYSLIRIPVTCYSA